MHTVYKNKLLFIISLHKYYLITDRHNHSQCDNAQNVIGDKLNTASESTDSVEHYLNNNSLITESRTITNQQRPRTDNVRALPDKLTR